MAHNQACLTIGPAKIFHHLNKTYMRGMTQITFISINL